jgi:curli biogenesis system outer membrane secretion channel CsgG
MIHTQDLSLKVSFSPVCPKRFPARIVSVALVSLLFGCSAHETHRSLEPVEIRSTNHETAAHPVAVAVGDFVNRSTYMNGLFSDGTDRLGKQAEQILVTHLSDSGAFTVVDRRNLAALEREAQFNGKKTAIQGAQALITGAVTEFGRKETGTKSLGGLIHKTKTQSLYAKVSLSVVDGTTSQVMHTYQGAGEYDVTNKEVLGFGGTAGYDGTLADKVLNLAIMEAVQRMVEGRERAEW